MTWRTRPRAKRSARSLRVNSVVAGTITAPSFIAASMHSHSATTLPSMTRMRSPRRTPSARSILATWFERSLKRGEGKLALASILVDEPQRRMGIVARHDVEIIERPVEAFELRPLEIAIGRGVILAMTQQEITRGDKRRRIA